MPEVGEEVLKVHVALDHLPFSTGLPPTEEAGMIGKINTEIDHDFLAWSWEKSVNRAR